MKKNGCLIALVVAVLAVLAVVALVTAGLLIVIAGRAGYGASIPDLRYLLHRVGSSLSYPHIPSFPNMIPAAPFTVLWGTFASAGKWVFTFAVSVVAYLLFPRQVERLGREAEVNPLPSFGWGFVVSIVVGLLTILFAITIIGIPLALLLSFAFGLARAFGLAGIGLVAGRIVRDRLSVKDPGQPIIDIAIGLGAIMIVSWVPLLGWLVSLAAGSIAIGAAYLSRLGTIAS